MPGGDRTGPMGMGPMTGRRAGYCAGYDVPGFASPVPGRGYGMGRGRGWFGGWGYGRGGGGRGWRHRFYATGRPGWARYGYDYGPAWDYAPPLSRDQELEGLKREAEWLKSQLDTINQRVTELEGEE
jgi:hypothetical protein